MQQKPVDQHDLAEARAGKRDAAHHGGPYLFPHDRSQISEIDLSQRDRADDRNRGLGAGVSSCIHQHRDKRGQDHLGRQRIFESCDDHPREGCGYHEQEQPGDTVLKQIQGRRAHIGLVRRRHTTHDLDVFRDLFLQDVHGVIERHDTDHSPAAVYDGHGEEVILGQHSGGLLLVCQRGDGDDVRIHQLFDLRLPVRTQQQILHRHKAKQLPFLRNIAGVDRLLVDAGPPDALKRLRDGHFRPEGDILGCHDGTCGILRIPEDLIDLLAHIRACLRQNALHHIGRHLLHKIYRVIDIQFIHHFMQFTVRESMDQELLCLRFHLHKRFSCRFLRQKAKQKRKLFSWNFIEDCSDVCRIHGNKYVADRRITLLLKKLAERLLDGYGMRSHTSLPPTDQFGYTLFNYIARRDARQPADSVRR